MMMGDFEITALSDGTFTLPMDTLLTNTTPAAVRRSLASVHLNAHVETSFNAFLINTGTRLVLVDTGAANTLGPTLGHVLTNLKAAGYHPDQIDEVLLTHAHLDHVGGLVVEGKRAFRNATVHLDKREAAFWLNRGNARFVPKAAQSSFQVATAALHPYASEGKVKLFDGNAQLLPGITAIAAHGHTPGHTLYSFESKSHTLVAWGDLVHCAPVQFAEPSVAMQFDYDQKIGRCKSSKSRPQRHARPLLGCRRTHTVSGHRPCAH